MYIQSTSVYALFIPNFPLSAFTCLGKQYWPGSDSDSTPFAILPACIGHITNN